MEENEKLANENNQFREIFSVLIFSLFSKIYIYLVLIQINWKKKVKVKAKVKVKEKKMVKKTIIKKKVGYDII